MPLRILLVANYGQDAQHSMLGFGRALHAGLCDLGFKVDVVAPRRRFWRPTAKLEKWCAYLDKYLLFPRELRRAAQQADVVHILDQGNGIYVNSVIDQPHLVTCHDLLAIRAAQGELPYWEPGRSGKAYQAAILKGLRRAKWVACVSSATRRDALRLLGQPETHVPLIKNGLYGQWSPAPASPKPNGLDALSPNDFLLHVGGDDPYKNRIAALPLFKALPVSRLVLAGRPMNGEVKAKADDLGLTDRVTSLVNPNDDQLRWLYSQAFGLVVTSRDEGFGLPILEAQACGCPVFIPDKEPMSEAAGEAAIRIDPTQPEIASNAILSGLNERKTLVDGGLANAAAHSTGAMVQAYAELYRQVAQG